MIKTILAAALVLSPAAALAGEHGEFVHEGTNYVYTTKQKGEATVIEGRSSRGEPFRLLVRGDRVTGTYNNHAVRFDAAQTRPYEVTLAN